jgi:hypothetical protein
MGVMMAFPKAYSMEGKRLTQIDLDQVSEEQSHASTESLPEPFQPKRTPVLRTLLPRYGKSLVRAERRHSSQTIPVSDGLDHLVPSESDTTTHGHPTMMGGYPWEKYESDNYERDLAG